MSIEGFKLSSQQARLWSRHGDSVGAFETHARITIRGDVDRARLREALEKVVDRHEILRTAFPSEVGMRQPLQVLPDEAGLVWVEAGESGSRDLIAGALLVARMTVDGEETLLSLGLPSMAADCMTMTILFDELCRAYADELDEGEELTQYVDYAQWQEDVLADEDAAIGRAFWQKLTASGAPELSLPPENREEHAFTPAACPVGLPEGLSLDETALITAWLQILYRLTGGNELVVLTMMDGRINDDLVGGCGPYATPVPLRVHPTGRMRFAELKRQVETALADARDNLELMTEDVPLPSAPMCFEYLELPEDREIDGARFHLDAVSATHVPFKIMLSARVRGGELGLSLLYDAGRYGARHIERLAESLTALASDHDPIAALRDAVLITPIMREELVTTFNATERDYPCGATIHGLFEVQAAKHAGDTAVIFEEHRQTFAQLNGLANQIARHLRDQGVGAESLVAIHMERSLLLPAAVLGVLKSGAAYVPMAANYPEARLAGMVEDSGVSFLITQKSHDANITAALPRLVIDDGDDQLADLSTENPVIDVDPHQPAYVIYTSGSTGKPKGVICHHRGVVNYLTWCRAAYHTHEGNGAPVHSSISFDLTVTSLFTPLLAGKPAVMVHEEEGIDSLMHTLREHPGFSLLKLTPAHLSILNQWITPDEPSTFAGTVVLGGEALLGESLGFWYENAPEVRIVNEYGPTETVVGCCVHQLQSREAGNIPIGRPIANMTLYLLDGLGRPVAYGEPGEIFIGGDGLARGYLGKPALTAERFLPDPFASEPGHRLYKTGDLARFSGEDEVFLTFLGRNDHQVKIRGYRIELGEIEAALRSHDKVDEAAVIARGDHHGARRLIAYVVSTRKPSTDELRTSLSARLPEYMVPSTFVSLDALPLTTNGKVDSARLPEPDHTRPNLDRAYVEPRDSGDAAMSRVWSEVLGIDRVGIHDNFFSLGGDSIKCLSIVAKAREEGIELTVPELFRHPTIEGIMDLVNGRAGEEGERVDDTLYTEPMSLIDSEDRDRLPADVEDAYPLGSVQLGMIFHMIQEKDNPNPPDYHNVNTFFCRLPFDPVLFQKAVDRVVAQQPILRTSFDLEHYSEPLQLVHRNARLVVEVEDLRHLDAVAARAEVDEYIRVENHRVMPLDVAPLMRLYVHWLEDNLISLSLTEPHAAADGWSTHMSLIDIFENAIAFYKGDPLPEPEKLSVDYRDFIAMERRAIDSPVTQAFWSEVVDRCKPTNLAPLPRRFQPPVAFKEHKFYFHLTADLSDGLRRLANTASVPLKSVIISGHLMVLSLITGNRDVTAGITFNGRLETADGERVRGLFLNTMPFPMHFAGGSWLDLIRSVYDQETEMIPHRRYPIGLAQKNRRDTLFVTGFSYHHFHSIESLLKSAEFEIVDTIDASTTNYDFMLMVNITPDDRQIVSLILEGQQEVVNKDQLRAYYGLYERVFTEMIAHPHGAYHEQDFLSRKERGRLVDEWARRLPASTEAPDCRRPPERAPQQSAVTSGAQHLESGDLTDRVAHLAGWLRARGLDGGTRVAYTHGDDPGSIVALLGILRAGGYPLAVPDASPDFLRGEILARSGSPWFLTLGSYTGPRGTCTLLDLFAHADEIAACPAFHGEVAPAGMGLSALGDDGALNQTTLDATTLDSLVADAVDAIGAGPEHSVALIGAMDTPINRLAVLGCGAHLALPDGEMAHDGAALASWLERVGVTHLLADAPTYRRLLVRSWQGRTDMVLFCGPSPPSRGLTRELSTRAGAVHLLFAPAGSAGFAAKHTARDVDFEDHGAEMPMPIGSTRSGVGVYLLNHFGQLVPTFTPGRIHLSGLAGAFASGSHIPDPFNPEHGAEMIATSLVGRYLPDGTLEFLGHAGDQVLLKNGYGNLGQIEAAVATHPLVLDTVALFDDCAEEPLTLCVSVADASLSAAMLTQYLGDMLPDYCIPRQIIIGTNIDLDRGILAMGGAAFLHDASSGGTPNPPFPLQGEGRFSLGQRVVPLPAHTSEERLAGAWLRLLCDLSDTASLTLAVWSEGQTLPVTLAADEDEPMTRIREVVRFGPRFASVGFPPPLSTLGFRIGEGTGLDGASPLSLELAVNASGEPAVLSYDGGRFSEAAVDLILHRLTAYVTGAPLIDARDEARARALIGQPAESDLAATTVDRFEAVVAAHSERIALVVGEERITYLDLDQRANALAHRLREMGAEPEVAVGVMLERSVDLIATLLAVQKTGAYYVPLDPAYPGARLAYMLTDSGAAVLVTDSVPEDLDTAGIPVLEPEVGAVATEPPPRITHGEQAAYVIYTSGSTGNPKGVQISRAALTNFLVSMAERPGFSVDDSLLAVTTVCFDISGLEIYLPLITGGRLVLAREAETRDGHALARLIESESVTVMQATPVTWRLLLGTGWRGEPDLRVLCGGEALPRDLAMDLRPITAGVFNMYGPTETTIWSGVRVLETEALAKRPAGMPVTIGGPIAGTALYILDEAGRPVPTGRAGELFIGGIGLARGYFRRPGLTAERFLPDPFAAEPGARMYRTGDLVRLMPEGDIAFIGRDDGQVKLRGYRIELGEIEAAMRAIDGIEDAAARIWSDYLAAYLVSGAQAPSRQAVKDALSEALPEYMVPSRFDFMERLPRTLNGKLDRKALPLPDGEVTREGLEAPRTETEEKIAALYRELLELSEVGRDDHFFELGGHSLVATRLLSRVTAQMGTPLTVRALFDNPRVHELAAHVDASLLVARGASEDEDSFEEEEVF